MDQHHHHDSPDRITSSFRRRPPRRRVPASSQSLHIFATLPREIILSIFRQVASPANHAPRYLAPFLVCGSEWFDLAYPFVWKMVCIHAITFKHINADGRAAYASSIETFLAAEICGCRRCSLGRHIISFADPADAFRDMRTLLSHEDVSVMRTIEAFPRLRALDVRCALTSQLVDIGEHLGASAEKLTLLRVGSWMDGCQRPRSSLDLLSSLHTNLEHLEVCHSSPSQVEPRPVCRQPHFPRLQSAHLFPYKGDDSGVLMSPTPTSTWEFPGSINNEHFPEWTKCSALLGALSAAPSLRRLRAFVSGTVGSLVRPNTPWDPPPRPGRRPFAALEELTIAIQSPTTLQHLPELRALTNLVIAFSPSEVDRSMMDILPQMPHLQRLKLLANEGECPSHSWCSTFTVADIAVAIKPMTRLQSLTFRFPAWLLNCDHTPAAHGLLGSIAINNPSLERLHLGFEVPFPLPAWNNAPRKSQSSSLQVLTIESHKLNICEVETEGMNTRRRFRKGARRLRRIFPLLRTLVATETGWRVEFTSSIGSSAEALH